MAGQERVQRKAPAKQETKEKETEVEAKTPEEAQALKDEMDSLLDEIDSVLEENAEEFVRGYVQKGGQAVKVFLNTVLDGIASVVARPQNLFPL